MRKHSSDHQRSSVLMFHSQLPSLAMRWDSASRFSIFTRSVTSMTVPAYCPGEVGSAVSNTVRTRPSGRMIRY